MSTSSPPSSINNNNNNDDGHLSPSSSVYRKDQACGPPDHHHAGSPPLMNHLNMANNFYRRPSQNNDGGGSMSPRIARKRSHRDHDHDHLDDDYQNDSDQKPILSSPSIVVTSEANSPLQSGRRIVVPMFNQPPPPVPGHDGDEDFDDDDDRDRDSDPTTRMIKKRHLGPSSPSNNWIQMDHYTGKQPEPEEKMMKQQQQRKSMGNNNNDDDHPAATRMDVSLYTTKKNVAQGMLDIALLSANCSQLKYLLYHYERDVPTSSTSGSGSSTISGWFSNNFVGSLDFYFATNLICLALSIFLQVIVGILLILNSRHNVYIGRYQRVADSYSNWILLAVFIVTVVNIFLSVFISAR